MGAAMLFFSTELFTASLVLDIIAILLAGFYMALLIARELVFRELHKKNFRADVVTLETTIPIYRKAA